VGDVESLKTGATSKPPINSRLKTSNEQSRNMPGVSKFKPTMSKGSLQSAMGVNIVLKHSERDFNIESNRSRVIGANRGNTTTAF
jgi:hypothetical protein